MLNVFRTLTPSPIVHSQSTCEAVPCRSARLVANPGCYPTSVQLPLAPLLQRKLIEAVCVFRNQLHCMECMSARYRYDT
jgi:N-acetyl-gamma-glutamylphosphate reductase